MAFYVAILVNYKTKQNKIEKPPLFPLLIYFLWIICVLEIISFIITSSHSFIHAISVIGFYSRCWAYNSELNRKNPWSIYILVGRRQNKSIKNMLYILW